MRINVRSSRRCDVSTDARRFKSSRVLALFYTHYHSKYIFDATFESDCRLSGRIVYPAFRMITVGIFLYTMKP